MPIDPAPIPAGAAPAPRPVTPPTVVADRARRLAAASLAGLTLVLAMAACNGDPRASTPDGGGGASRPAHAPATLEAGATAVVTTGEVPSVDTRAYAVFDVTAGRMLATSAADEELPVGSLMKMLNAWVAYDAGDAGREVHAPPGIAGEPGESIIGIAAGQTLTRDVLIRAMLKVSANDAARLLAIDIAGSEDAYADMMNDAARELGLDATVAVNATGLDAEGQHSSARDLVTLGVDLLRNPAFAATVADRDARLNGQTFPNTNDLLGTYDGADGVKTGHTTEAGWCLLASATRDGRQIVAAVLGAPSEPARDAAAATLLDWGFTQP